MSKKSTVCIKKFLKGYWNYADAYTARYLLKLIMALPYAAAGRICWLAGALAVCTALLYAFIGWIFFDDFSFKNRENVALTGTTIAALIVALYFNRRAFRTGEEHSYQ